jgi:hypothetical protein
MKIVAYQGGLFICDNGEAIPRPAILGEPGVGKTLVAHPNGFYTVSGEAKPCGT